jgi:hypothetical protein
MNYLAVEIRLRHSDFSHSVKYITTESGFGLLVSNASTAHVPTDNSFIPIDGILHRQTATIIDMILPGASPVRIDVFYVDISLAELASY